MYKSALFAMAFPTAVGCGVVLEPNPPPDHEAALAVAITSPVAGQPVSALVVVAANVVADNAVASARFDLPDGNSVIDRTAPFSTTWDSTTVPDGTYVVRVTATDDEGATGTTDTAITVANRRCLRETHSAQGLPRSIPDASPTGVTSSIQIPGSGTVASLSLSLEIRHRYPIELDVELISPAGTRFPVSRHVDTPTADIVFTNQAIASFNGQAAAGAWNLRVIDAAKYDLGTLNSWSLTIVRNCTPPAP
jgi:hypothetical protein